MAINFKETIWGEWEGDLDFFSQAPSLPSEWEIDWKGREEILKEQVVNPIEWMWEKISWWIETVKEVGGDVLQWMWNLIWGSATWLTGDIPTITWLWTKIGEEAFGKWIPGSPIELAFKLSKEAPDLLSKIPWLKHLEGKSTSDLLMEGGEELKNALQEKIGVETWAVTTRIGEFLTPDVLFWIGKVYKAYKVSKLPAKQLAKLNKEVVEDFTKAIKPSTKTASQKAYKANTLDAVVNITWNKNRLNITDEFGEALVDKLPENVNQFSQSIGNLKKWIYDDYHKIALKAGKEVKADLSPLVKELTKLKSDRRFLDVATDWSKKYLDDVIRTFKEKGGKRNLIDLESVKQSYNSKLQSFYKNPNPNDFDKSLIDALTNNQMGKILDDTIWGVSWKQYTTLKKMYWNLSSIEKDVLHRSIIEARKNNASLLDYSDIFSIGDIARGLASQNAWLVAKWTVGKALKEYLKFINNPDVIIKKMFNKADEILQLTK